MQVPLAREVLRAAKWISIGSVAIIASGMLFAQSAITAGFALLHCDEFTGGKVRLRLILVNTRSEAEMVVRKLRGGQSFADLATRYSVDDATKADGGLAGLLSERDLRQEFRAALKGLRAGDTTGIISLIGPSTEPGPRRKTASASSEGESITFSDVLAPVAPSLPGGDVIVQRFGRSLPPLTSTGYLVSLDGLKKMQTVDIEPAPEAMFITVIFDLYSDKAPLTPEEAFHFHLPLGTPWSEVLSKQDIALVAAGGLIAAPWRLEGEKEGSSGLDGVRIWKGGNRILAIFEVKAGDPSGLHLKIKGKDHGSLGQLALKSKIN